MAVSLDEDKVVCLTSFGLLSMLKLYGLKSGTMPLKFPSLKETGRQHLVETSRAQLGEEPMETLQTAAVSNIEDNAEATDIDQLVEEMNFVLSSDDSEADDKDESDESQGNQ